MVMVGLGGVKGISKYVCPFGHHCPTPPYRMQSILQHISDLPFTTTIITAVRQRCITKALYIEFVITIPVHNSRT